MKQNQINRIIKQLTKIFGKKVAMIIAIIILAISFLVGNSNTNNYVIDEKYDVIRVVDGDTIIVKFNGKNERLRFIGINTPESVAEDESRNRPEGHIASDYTKKLLSDKKVGLEFDVQERDKFGRLLAYVYLDGKMVNKTLLEKGYAQVMSIQPNVKYADEMLKLERKARADKSGFWEDGKF